MCWWGLSWGLGLWCRRPSTSLQPNMSIFLQCQLLPFSICIKKLLKTYRSPFLQSLPPLPWCLTSDIGLASPCIVPFLLTPSTPHCPVCSRHLIRVWLISISPPLHGWPAWWPIDYRCNRLGLATWHPLRLARHGGYGCLVCLHISILVVAWMGVVFWLLTIHKKGCNSMLAGDSCQVPYSTIACPIYLWETAPPAHFLRCLGQTHVNGWSRVIASQNGGSTSYIFPLRLGVLQWGRHLFNYLDK